MRPVRGRRDRCPWDARAFLVREAPETNGRRASTDHAFPREKKLRCVYVLSRFATDSPGAARRGVFDEVPRPADRPTDRPAGRRGRTKKEKLHHRRIAMRASNDGPFAPLLSRQKRKEGKRE